MRNRYKILITTLAILVAGLGCWVFSQLESQSLSFGNELPELQKTQIDFNGKIISFDYTDNNDGENLIIKTDKMIYGGWENIEVLFSITNISGLNEDVNMQFYFNGEEMLADISEFIENLPYEIIVSDYGPKDYSCETNWIASTTLRMEEEINGYICGKNEFKICDSIDKTICHFNNVYLGTHPETRYKDGWNNLTPTLAVEKDISAIIPAKYIRDDITVTYTIANNETKYFKANISIPSKSQGEFWIYAASNNSFGILDPWYSSSWDYCRKVTINNAYIATTTTAFPIVATTTLADLKTSANGGKVEKDAGEDIIFVSGTDCNTDSGSLLNYQQEKYASTTGQIVYWVETEIASTTDKYFLMYYGNAGASDQSTTTAIWKSDKKLVIHAGEATGSTSLTNSSLSGHIITANGNASTTNRYNHLNNSAAFDGTGDYLSVTSNADWYFGDGDFTIDTWIRVPSVTSIQHYIIGQIKDWQNAWRIHINNDDVIFFNSVAGPFSHEITASDCISANTWHHIAVVRNGGSWVIYVDGLAEGTYSGSFTMVDVTGHTLRIGEFNSHYYTGYIDELRVSKGIGLHAMDVLTIYKIGSHNASALTIGAEETETPEEIAPIGNIIYYWGDE